MKTFVKCGTVNVKVLYYLGMGFSQLFISISSNIFGIIEAKLNGDKKEIKYSISKFVGFEIWLMFISESLIGMCSLITMCLNSSNQKEDQKKKVKVKVNEKQIKNWKIYLITLFLAALDLFNSGFLVFLQNVIFPDIPVVIDSVAKSILFLFQPVFCMIILKYRYHRHHIIGFTLIIFAVFFTDILNYESSKGKDFQFKFPSVLTFIAMIILQIFVSLKGCVEKLMMEKYFVSPLELLTLEGIFGTVLCTAMIFVVYYSISGEEEYFFSKPFELIAAKPLNGILHIIFYVIGCFFFNFLIFLVYYEFSPTHRSIGDTVGSIFKWILSLIIVNNQPKKYIFYTAIIYIFQMTGALIFNEIILILCCNLNYNTSKEIEKRENLDMLIGTKEDKDMIQELPPVNKPLLMENFI